MFLSLNKNCVKIILLKIPEKIKLFIRGFSDLSNKYKSFKLMHQEIKDDLKYLKRTIGPGTWVYEVLEQVHEIKTWDLLQSELNRFKHDFSKQKQIIQSFRQRTFPR